jgi:hypothetical protein
MHSGQAATTLTPEWALTGAPSPGRMPWNATFGSGSWHLRVWVAHVPHPSGRQMMEPFSTRRQIVLAAGAGLALAAGAREAGARQTPEAQETATLPDWQFAVHIVQDPYAGTMQAPATAPAGTRYAAAEVEVINNSDQALNFTPVDVRIRDAAGVDYRGGGAIGTEPMIGVRNLNPGERSRGWVWFTIPAGAVLVELVYVAPAPQFRVTL